MSGGGLLVRLVGQGVCVDVALRVSSIVEDIFHGKESCGWIVIIVYFLLRG